MGWEATYVLWELVNQGVNSKDFKSYWRASSWPFVLDSHVIHGDILLQDHEKGLKFRKGEEVPKVPLAWEEHLLQ